MERKAYVTVSPEFYEMRMHIREDNRLYTFRLGDRDGMATMLHIISTHKIDTVHFTYQNTGD